MSAPAGMILKLRLKFVSPFPDLIQIKFLNLIQKGFLCSKVLLINGLGKFEQAFVVFVIVPSSKTRGTTDWGFISSVDMGKGLAPNIPVFLDSSVGNLVFVSFKNILPTILRCITR